MKKSCYAAFVACMFLMSHLSYAEHADGLSVSVKNVCIPTVMDREHNVVSVICIDNHSGERPVLDDVDVALACDADGVHVGQKDLPVEVVRQLLGPEKIVGLSINNAEQMALVDPKMVDYVGVGPIFSTTTKPDAAAPIGFDGLKKLMQICPVPAVAIGGIKAHHIESAVKAGVQGVAVISAICGQDDPEQKTRELVRLWKQNTI